MYSRDFLKSTRNILTSYKAVHCYLIALWGQLQSLHKKIKIKQPVDCDYGVGNHWSITIISCRFHKYAHTIMKSDQSSRGSAQDTLILVPAVNKSWSPQDQDVGTVDLQTCLQLLCFAHYFVSLHADLKFPTRLCFRELNSTMQFKSRALNLNTFLLSTKMCLKEKVLKIVFFLIDFTYRQSQATCLCLASNIWSDL